MGEFHTQFIMKGASLDFSTIVAKGCRSQGTTRRSNSQNRSNINTGRARPGIGGGDHVTENDSPRSRRHPSFGKPYNMFGGILRYTSRKDSKRGTNAPFSVMRQMKGNYASNSKMSHEGLDRSFHQQASYRPTFKPNSC